MNRPAGMHRGFPPQSIVKRQAAKQIFKGKTAYVSGPTVKLFNAVTRREVGSLFPLFSCCLLLFALLNGSSFFPLIYSDRPKVNINIPGKKADITEKLSYLTRNHI